MATLSSLKEYFEATFEAKLLSQVPEHDGTYLTPATRLLEVRHEMLEVEQALNVHKEEFQSCMAALQIRKDKLQLKEDLLTESLKKFDKWLKENDARKKRAQRKTQDELIATKEKEGDIEMLTRQLELLKKHQARQGAVLDKLQIYESYLQRVIEVSDFADIGELMDRYETLDITHKDLLASEQIAQARIDGVKRESMSEKEAHRIAVLGANNTLAGLQSEVEKLKTDAIYWEGVVSQVQLKASKRTLLLGRLKMAISNLYALVEERSSRDTFKLPDPIQQLEKVLVFIQDLQDVTTEFATGPPQTNAMDIPS